VLEGCCRLELVSQSTTVLCLCTAFCDFLQEALEMGSAALLLDEDTCASNAGSFFLMCCPLRHASRLLHWIGR